MRCSMIAVLLATASLGARLDAQVPAIDFPPRADTAIGIGGGDSRAPTTYVYFPAPLPAELTPVASESAPIAVVVDDGVTPYLLGIFGGIAGWFVGGHVLTRGCTRECDMEKLLMGFLGATAGAVLGYLAGGGELPEPPGRWP